MTRVSALLLPQALEYTRAHQLHPTLQSIESSHFDLLPQLLLLI